MVSRVSRSDGVVSPTCPCRPTADAQHGEFETCGRISGAVEDLRRTRADLEQITADIIAGKIKTRP